MRAVMTALYEREHTGVGRLVEVAMEEAVYPTLASNLGMQYDSESPIARTGNRHGGLAISPYNVYPTKDGYIALACVVENHWPQLLEAMGREDLKDDPRFATNAQRCARHGRNRCDCLGVGSEIDQPGSFRNHEALSRAVLARAQFARSDERSSHARARHAGMD